MTAQPLTVAALDEIDKLAGALTKKLYAASRAAEADGPPRLDDITQRMRRLCIAASATSRLAASLATKPRE
jgi:hypothetical protein